MTKTVTVKLSRGTYTCPITGQEEDLSLLLSRADQPGVVYPFPDSLYVEELVVNSLLQYGLATLTNKIGVEVFEESTEFPPTFFEVCVTAPGSGSVH